MVFVSTHKFYVNTVHFMGKLGKPQNSRISKWLFSATIFTIILISYLSMLYMHKKIMFLFGKRFAGTLQYADASLSLSAVGKRFADTARIKINPCFSCKWCGSP